MVDIQAFLFLIPEFIKFLIRLLARLIMYFWFLFLFLVKISYAQFNCAIQGTTLKCSVSSSFCPLKSNNFIYSLKVSATELFVLDLHCLLEQFPNLRKITCSKNILCPESSEFCNCPGTFRIPKVKIRIVYLST